MSDLAGKEANPVLTVLLDLIHSEVGVLGQARNINSVTRIHRDADGSGCLTFVTVEHNRFTYCGEKPMGHFFRIVAIFNVMKHHYEFIAPEPGDDIALSRGAPEPRADLDPLR